MVRPAQLLPRIFDGYNENPHFLVPTSYHLPRNSLEEREVAATFKKMYFGGENLSSSNLHGFADYHTDAQFKLQTQRFLLLFQEHSSMPIYKYDFSYEGSLSFVKSILLLSSWDGVCHADDLFYLFSPSFPIFMWPWDHAATVRERFVRLQANFAKTG